MTTDAHETWDPRSPAVQADQIGAYDQLRHRTSLASSDHLGWSVLRHRDVVAVLADHDTFSNAVSTHLNVPNGMDPPQHTSFREIVDRYFTAELVETFEPTCRDIARTLLAAISGAIWVDVMPDVAEIFAVRVQSAYLGWPEEMEGPLTTWVRDNHRATLGGDPTTLAAVVARFDDHIRRLLTARRSGPEGQPADLTSRLVTERVEDRSLSDDEIISMLRNWTVGELGTIAASIGIVAHYLATHLDLQAQLRAGPASVPTAIDEILRIHAPLISNRRITRCPASIGDHALPAGERLTLVWASANRDEAVFGDPDEFRLDRDPEANLLYGAGIHLCPGASLARLELRVLVEELLSQTRSIELVAGMEAVRALHPASGYAQLPLQLR